MLGAFQLPVSSRKNQSDPLSALKQETDLDVCRELRDVRHLEVAERTLDGRGPRREALPQPPLVQQVRVVLITRL